jgi:hypothetical protein
LRDVIRELVGTIAKAHPGEVFPVAIWMNSRVTSGWLPQNVRQREQFLREAFSAAPIAQATTSLSVLRPGDELKLASRALEVLLPQFDQKIRDKALLVDLRPEATLLGVLDGGQLFWVRVSTPNQPPSPLQGWKHDSLSSVQESRAAILERLIRQPCASYRDTKPAVGAVKQLILYGDMSAAWARKQTGPPVDGMPTTQTVYRRDVLSPKKPAGSLAVEVRRDDFVAPAAEWSALGVTVEQFAVSAEILQSAVDGLELTPDCAVYLDERLQFAIECAVRWEQLKRWPTR